MRHHHHSFMRAMRERFHAWHHHHHDHAEEILERHAGRHGFRGGLGGDDAFSEFAGVRGGGRRSGGRMFGHGDLKLLLLALLEQQPRHGYELIRTIEDMFHGHYSPSPGAIYPTLTMLEEMGHARVESEQGGRKLYAITDEGRRFLDENRAAVEAMTARTEHSARMAAKMAMPPVIRQAMHAVKHALLMRTEWSRSEAQRVAEILERAAADIAARPPKD